MIGFAIDSAYIAVDGVGCPIQEPHLFSPASSSYNFHNPASRYKIAVWISSKMFFG